jgi:hypothetical protein
MRARSISALDLAFLQAVLRRQQRFLVGIYGLAQPHLLIAVGERLPVTCVGGERTGE